MAECYKVCPQCGKVYRVTSPTWAENICYYCKAELVSTGIEKDPKLDGHQTSAVREEIEHKYLKEHIFPDPLKREAYKNRKEIEELEVELSIEESQNAAMSYASDCPHCPTCGSSSVEKIGGLERGVSVVVLGIFSKKINKSYKCRNCGHTW